MGHEDSYMVEKCLEGDRSAFAVIVDKYKRQIYSITYSMTQNHADADDLSQDTFIKAYENLRKFKPGTNFRSWLCRIAVNSCIDHLRHRKRFPEDHLNAQADLLSNGSPDPQDNLESNELMENITTAVDSLPKSQRTVVILREMQGLGLKEIAGILECSESTVRWRLHYARKKLQKKLQGYLDET
jgi:RNA polymerase sigma-70 factor (ECF subfamily)